MRQAPSQPAVSGSPHCTSVSFISIMFFKSFISFISFISCISRVAFIYSHISKISPFVCTLRSLHVYTSANQPAALCVSARCTCVLSIYANPYAYLNLFKMCKHAIQPAVSGNPHRFMWIMLPQCCLWQHSNRTHAYNSPTYPHALQLRFTGIPER